MKTLLDQVANYAAYHRDPRNIATHFVGIPMIVLAVTALLSRPAFEVAGFTLSPAVLAALASSLYYLRLELRLGLVMAVLMAVSVLAGQWLAAQSTALWLSTGIGVFVVGWVLQFIGHYYEGRKPAFVDDIMGLIIGPLFVVVELAFALGLRKELQQAVESRVGPVRARDLAAPKGA
jgi:uncharacterized membrane protein YGL010W